MRRPPGPVHSRPSVPVPDSPPASLLVLPLSHPVGAVYPPYFTLPFFTYLYQTSRSRMPFSKKETAPYTNAHCFSAKTRVNASLSLSPPLSLTIPCLRRRDSTLTRPLVDTQQTTIFSLQL
ncbi:hypothetical protein L249_1979, partial [Ophiocordyceps polyrhachis-furcata BCC 54312]